MRGGGLERYVAVVAVAPAGHQTFNIFFLRDCCPDECMYADAGLPLLSKQVGFLRMHRSGGRRSDGSRRGVSRS